MTTQTILHSFQELGAHFGLTPQTEDVEPDIMFSLADDENQPDIVGDLSGSAVALTTPMPVPAPEAIEGGITREVITPVDEANAEAAPSEASTGALASGTDDFDLEALVAELESACGALSRIARQDQEARALALHDLAEYDRLTGVANEAERARERARQVLEQAEALVASAFAAEARAAAEQVLSLAAAAESRAGAVADQRRAEADALVARLDLARLVEERRREEESEKARATEAECLQQLSGTLAEAREACDLGRFEEARAMLGAVVGIDPDNADVASLKEIIARRELSVKCTVAEELLWEARRRRSTPAEAVAALETVDVTGLPVELARQVFGEWARACARLCRERNHENPLRYAPDPGRGAVIVREPGSNAHVVLSALSMGPGWRPGAVIDERQVRRARPLR